MVHNPPPLLPFLCPTACSSLTRTLDSGIGTFPPPDYGGVPTKGAPKPRGIAAPPPSAPPAPPPPPPNTKVPRKARTLERELPGVEELMGKRRSGPTAPHSGVSAAQRGGLQGGCRMGGVPLRGVHG